MIAIIAILIGLPSPVRPFGRQQAPPDAIGVDFALPAARIDGPSFQLPGASDGDGSVRFAVRREDDHFQWAVSAPDGTGAIRLLAAAVPEPAAARLVAAAQLSWLAPAHRHQRSRRPRRSALR